MDRHSPLHSALLSPDQMHLMDLMAIDNGVPGFELMKNAGRAVFDRLIAAFPDVELIHIFCGPGNNGGDGYIVAELLRQAGRSVRVFALGDPEQLPGDGGFAFRQWRGETFPISEMEPDAAELVVDALFGAGLARDIEGETAAIINEINESGTPVLSIDLPSGISGASGKVCGVGILAEETVTFFRQKPGHVLNPGKGHCGQITIADIGIADKFLETLSVTTFENATGLWQAVWPGYTPDSNKYTRGHAVILSGGEFSTGASRLSATAALRAGAGLVSVTGDRTALRVHAAHLTAVMLKPADTLDELSDILSDLRITAIGAGPGLGTDQSARAKLDAVLATSAALTLDADVFTLFADSPEVLFEQLKSRDRMSVLTPHEGEFKRIFGPLPADADKMEIAKSAAERSTSVVVLKGSDTVIAAPDGRIAINSNAPPWLSTAGSGDVLTGIITGLLAQGMPAFEAACAGVWLHGEAGNRCGPYLTADDLESGLAELLEEDSHDWAEDIDAEETED
ncbi:NAD(P)H-hydrate dehydratase [Ponticaulis sp.]|uniref:NAD(P)H-hydrate dehydratase n=1 Tax=Ponticaulis sp. TaxID=2020902 RepID=UPI000B6F0F59|nr:NAD(P)H-hydrate dehydratase [Ponticaulis sp.]MAI89147.1 bifunctional ADP-dependent NAD(P)H-hydrate dehydratase/NAD(P)H-hydrate epimerase [Ponticaulis sp.]OUY01314.1 MAG: hypothetical protein CBB65_01515 [Hyphomonadaceae bacterium TMED5]